jgi:putative hydrolase of the HAD superfamily
VKTPKFLYFDLGKVLVDFSYQRMFRQMAAAVGVEPVRVEETLVSSGLQNLYESGKISGREFAERFCLATGGACDCDTLLAAHNDIFALNPTMLAVVAQLGLAGYRLGVLSNTCQGHWEHCRRQYRILDTFSVYALSYRVGACKPAAQIFQAAAEMAGCRPAEIFYTDDIAGHVAAAQSMGFDAVQYASTPQLVAELRNRGVRFNY